MLTNKNLPLWFVLLAFILVEIGLERYLKSTMMIHLNGFTDKLHKALGIKSGPTPVTYITAQGEPIILAGLTGSDGYQALIADSIANEDIEASDLDDTNLLPFVDYNDAYLELCVADVDGFIFVEEVRKRFAHVGSEKLLEVRHP
ncbi:hypothetical protein MGN70_005365 [Eutypa lata]|uniref:Uncharacterized protein n=1 Tax=Eutypa lata (strain UCR-EL1) TaxID=1287681 RepID=M7T622_EUTLA|nr:hypothetical protein UCREL1_616 [Eutypa lata UCREL1]KAI1253157.1 hypothetical protein MGN70_005365 [Eutypa lata]